MVFVVAIAFAGLLAYRLWERRKVKNESLEEPLIEEVPVKEEPRKKAFEGTWVADDGSRVTIDGTTLVRPDGKVEKVEDLEEGLTLYTHRMTVKKGWFSESVEVQGKSGTIEDNGLIKWTDGKVWKREDEGIQGA